MKEPIKAYSKANGLTSSSRKRELTYKRCYLYQVLKNEGLSLTEIGKMFNRNHATIINGIKIYELFKEDEYFNAVTKEEQTMFPLFKNVAEYKIELELLMYENFSKFDNLILNK